MPNPTANQHLTELRPNTELGLLPLPPNAWSFLQYFGLTSQANPNPTAGPSGDGNIKMAPDKLMFKDCGGLEKQINFLKTAIMGPLTDESSSQYERFGLEPPKGILFYGPPGTGKTRLAQALCNEISKITEKPVHFIYRKGNDIASMYFGESSSNLRNVFNEANRMKPTVLFFDELDGLCPRRDKPFISEAYVTIVTTLLGLMDEVVTGEVFVIGATNRIDDIDSALRRPGRFDKYLEFLPPSEQGRHQILEIHTRKWKTKPTADLLKKLSNETNGFTGADLAKLCMDSFDTALTRHINEEEKKKHIFTYADMDFDELAVTNEDWKLALSKIRSSVVGVFGSTQYIPDNKSSADDYVRPLVETNFQNVKIALLKILTEGRKNLNLNDDNMDIDDCLAFHVLYIWSGFECSLSSLEDFIISPLFGTLGGEDISNYPKYCLSAEILYCTRSQDWPRKVNDTFTQAIASHVPSILYIPDIHSVCQAIKNYHLTAAVNLKQQLERLRNTHVLLVITGTTSPESVRKVIPFRNETVKIELPSCTERREFFNKLFAKENFIARWSEEQKADFENVFNMLLETTKGQEIGSIVELFGSIFHELVYRNEITNQTDPDEMMEFIVKTIADYDISRARVNSHRVQQEAKLPLEMDIEEQMDE